MRRCEPVVQPSTRRVRGGSALRRILLLLTVAIILAALAAGPAFSRVIVLPNSTPCDQAANQAPIVEKTKEKECVVSTPAPAKVGPPTPPPPPPP